MSAALDNLDPKQQALVRTRVRGLLEQSEAFKTLPPHEQRAMAKSLVDTVAYLADPKAGQSLAKGLARGQQGEEGQPPQGIGDAARAGTQAYEDLTDAVDFPKFVAGLIDGVFNAIVTASIRQMEAYQKLLENVTKSVDGFAKDNFTLNQGRDSLVDRFPNLLQIDNSGGQPRLAPTPEGEENGLDEVKSALGMDKEIDLSDETSEKELARRAQFEMAKLRQKQLATMVLMGINRIVVTNGLINAKVVVDVRTKDTMHEERTHATSYDDTRTGTHAKGGGWFSSEFKRDNYNTIIKSATEDKKTEDQSVETKAQLTGEVKINFKSETFPLDKLASQTDLEAVTERTR